MSILRLECFLLLTNWVLLSVSRSNRSRPQQASHSFRQSDILAPRMRPKASTVQSLLGKSRNEIFFGQNEVARFPLDGCLRYSAAHPEESCQIDACSCR